MLVNDTAAACIARSGYGRKRYLPRFPAEGVCVGTGRRPKGNKVSWNVVRLDDIMYVRIVKVSPTTKLNVQLAPVALCANAVPGRLALEEQKVRDERHRAPGTCMFRIPGCA